MERYHVFRDGTNFGAASTREEAIDLIRAHQRRETHPFLKAQFSIIKGEEEFIPYEPLVRSGVKEKKGKSNHER